VDSKYEAELDRLKNESKEVIDLTQAGILINYK